MPEMNTVEDSNGYNGVGLLKNGYVIEYLQTQSGKKRCKVNTYLLILMENKTALINALGRQIKNFVGVREIYPEIHAMYTLNL